MQVELDRKMLEREQQRRQRAAAAASKVCLENARIYPLVECKRNSSSARAVLLPLTFEMSPGLQQWREKQDVDIHEASLKFHDPYRNSRVFLHAARCCR